jgi:hypothetical protein
LFLKNIVLLYHVHDEFVVCFFDLRWCDLSVWDKSKVVWLLVVSFFWAYSMLGRLIFELSPAEAMLLCLRWLATWANMYMYMCSS